MLNELQPITARLLAADRACQKEVGGSVLLRSIKYVLGLVVLGFVVDVFLHLKPGQRLGILAVWALVTLGVLARSAYLVWLRRSRLERVARVLEQRDPALGSKLINLLQLEGVTRDASLAPLTRELAQLAVSGYAEELKGLDFEQLARTPCLKVEFKKALLAGVVCAALLCAFYPITLIELARFADPLGDHPPYSMTRLEILEPGPQGAQVIYHKSHVVKVKYLGHKPGDVFLTYHPVDKLQPATTLPMFGSGGATFAQAIEKIESDLVVVAHTRGYHSYSQKRQIHVLLTPKLEKALVQISPPAYTGLKPEETAFQFKDVRALVGSNLRFRLQSNRPLRDGAIEIIKSDANVQRVPMRPTALSEVAGQFDARHSARLRFSLTDTNGLPSQDPWEGSLTLTYDLPPEVQIAHPSKDCFVSIDFNLEVQVEATDDYGLKQLRLHCATNQVFGPPKVINYPGIVRQARETFPFNFRALGVRPGDTVTLFAEVIDTAPEPNLARSQTVNVRVISEEEYNAFLREQSDISDIEGKYADLLGQFQDRVAEQKQLGQDIESLKSKAADPKTKEAAVQELDRLLARQNELNQKLDKLAKTMDQFVRPKPLYDIETELQRLLSQKANDIRSSTATNNGQTRDVSTQSAPPAGPRQISPSLVNDFKRASDEQLARLGGAQQKAEEAVMNTLQDMSEMQEMMKDFNLFEALYQAQKSLVDQARAYNRPGQLSREDQLALKNLAATERQVSEALDQLADKLRADARTGEKHFPKAAQGARDLAKQMEEARLSNLAKQATDTLLAGAGADSFQLSDRLRQEMEKLFSECKSQGGQRSNEMDTYLRLQRGLNPRNSFAQMQQSRKFGNGKNPGFAMGQGSGQEGNSGYAVTSEPSIDVLGNETFVERSARPSPAGPGRGASDVAGAGQKAEQADVRRGLNAVNRPAEAVTTESLVEEYRGLVDAYFKTITKK